LSGAPGSPGAGGACPPNDDDRARRLEVASLGAWPALTESDFDGWRLRFANGYTRRSNSITPLEPSRIDLAQKVEACERIYADRGLPIIFRLTPFAPAGLDEFLAARGYALGEVAEVRALRLGGSSAPPPRPPRPPRAASIRVEPVGLDRWLEAFTSLSRSAGGNRLAHRQVLAAVPGTRRLLLLVADGHPVSCGMSVLHEGLIGLFDLVTGSAHRRRGFGGELLQRALAWGRRAGADEAYLQVVETNLGAVRLYQRAGFETVYRYHYRERSL
jgi:GNAT superfamily N-acetyltransferase